MTTSSAAGWLIAVAGFTGLVGMQLVLVRAVRSERRAWAQRALRAAAAAQVHGGEGGGAKPIPGPGGPLVGPQRAASAEAPPTA